MDQQEQEQQQQQEQQSTNVFVYNGENTVPRDATHVKFDSSIIEIPPRLFFGYNRLQIVELNEGLLRIGSSAFNGCSSLESINFPSTLKVIEEHAFYYCRKLRAAELNKELQFIGFGVFYYCAALTSIRLPSMLQNIGNGAFYFCTNLERVYIPNGLKTIGKAAFCNCSRLLQVSIPSSVKKIEERAFGSCFRLEAVELYDGLQTIAERAFWCCSSLKRIAVPPSVTKIGHYCFHGCKDLISLELANGLEEIGGGALAGCEKLQNLYIPSSVTFQMDSVFMDPSLRQKVPQLYQERFQRHDDGGGGGGGEYDSQIINGLKTRFHNLPIHEICYFQAHFPTATTLEKLKEAIASSSTSTSTTTPKDLLEKVDVFGMTPLHILAISAKPNRKLIKAILEYFPNSHIVFANDLSCFSMMDYLVSNIYETLDTRVMAKQLLKEVLVQLTKSLGCEEWRDDILAEAENFPFDGRRELQIIVHKLGKYQTMEALSLLEISLWSIKVNATDSVADNEVDRESCRINSGAEIIIPNIVPFLGYSLKRRFVRARAFSI